MSACAVRRHAWHYWTRHGAWENRTHWRRCQVCNLREKRYLGVWVAR